MWVRAKPAHGGEFREFCNGTDAHAAVPIFGSLSVAAVVMVQPLSPAAVLSPSAAGPSSDDWATGSNETSIIDLLQSVIGLQQRARPSSRGGVNFGDSYSQQANSFAEDWAMVQSVITSVVTIVISLAFFAAARSSPRLMRHVFAPRAWAAGVSRGAGAFPGLWGWIAELRDDAKAVVAGDVGLEQAMLMRYIRFNLRLLAYATVLTFALLTPFYAASPASHTLLLTPSINASDAILPERNWTALQTITISHVPEGSWRLIMPGVSAILFALVYIYELTLEWRHYVVAKHAWLCEEGVQHHAVLLHAEGSQEVRPEEMYVELVRVVGDGEVLSVAPVHQLRAGQSDAGLLEQVTYGYVSEVSRKAQPLLSATKIDRVSEAVGGAVGGAMEAGPVKGATDTVDSVWQAASGSLWEAVRLVFCGEDEPQVTRLLALMRTRRAAAICVAMSRWPGELLERPGIVRAEAAPAPGDAFWPNLLKTHTRVRANWLIGMALSYSIFLFWTIPVAAVQTLASLNSLAMLDGFHWLQDLLTDDALSATLSGFVSSMVLQGFLFLTLNSGLFQWLARMQGEHSETAVYRSATSRVLLFQLLLVLLGSNITASLLDSAREILENPTNLPIMLAQSIPGQATFFMHYVLSGILFVALFDGFQCIALLANGIIPCCAAACFKDRAASIDEVTPGYDGATCRMRVVNIYAKLFMMMGIWLTFMIVAPLSGPISFLYFVPSYWIYGVVLRQIDGVPEVDTAGECWEEAIRYSNITYLIAYVILIGILILKRSIPGAVLTGAAAIYVAVRSYRLQQKFSGQATALSLQRCVDLHEGRASADSENTLLQYATSEGQKAAADWEPEGLTARYQEYRDASEGARASTSSRIFGSFWKRA